MKTFLKGISVAAGILALAGSVNAAEVKLTQAEMEKATQLYFDRCSGCHGMLRKGALGPSLEPIKLKEKGYNTDVLYTIIHDGTPGGMPDWGASGELSKEETQIMSKFIQLDPPAPLELSMEQMKGSWKVHTEVSKRPKKPETKRNWKNYMGVVMRDVGQVAIIDGDTKELVNIVKSGFAVHILRTSASGRYMYTIGRDGKATVIDLWMNKPETVAEVKTCYDARSIDTSKYKGPKGDFMDKLAVVGCYWPSSIVTLDGETLEPLKLVSTASYHYDTQDFAREARVAAIVASHTAPEWVINVKETGQVWLYDYSDVRNPTIKMIESERYLHDGGWDLSKRYFLVAANARHKIVAIDVQERKLVGIIPTNANIPHPGRGANINHKTYGPIWCTGHIGDKRISCIGTDPDKHKKYAWKVAKEFDLPGEGGGNLFIKTHPNAKYMYADRPVNPDRKLQNQIYVIDKDKLEVIKTIPIPEKYTKTIKVDGKDVTPRGPVHFEFNEKGDEVWVAVWGNKHVASAILIYDDKTLTLKKEITGDWVRTPTGHFNVANTMGDIY